MAPCLPPLNLLRPAALIFSMVLVLIAGSTPSALGGTDAAADEHGPLETFVGTQNIAALWSGQADTRLEQTAVRDLEELTAIESESEKEEKEAKDRRQFVFSQNSTAPTRSDERYAPWARQVSDEARLLLLSAIFPRGPPGLRS